MRAFLKNGEVEISNNFAENAIRPFVIGRKNWLFSDTVKGAKSSAIIYSLIETAKANGVEPYAYLTLVLTDMQYMDRPFSNEVLESFMPWSEELKDSILIIPHSGKHGSAGRKTSIRGEENADSRKERSNSPKERISCRI